MPHSPRWPNPRRSRISVGPDSSPSRAARRALLALLSTLLGCLATTSTAVAVPTYALPASGFRDSVGVQMHHTFKGYASDRTSTDTLARMLDDLGIWHVRDSVCLAEENQCLRPRWRMSQLRTRATWRGLPPIEYLLGITREVETHPERSVRDADIERALTALVSWPLAGSVGAIEETNEPDLQKRSDWTAIVKADDDVIRAKLSEPRFAALRSLPLLSPSMGHPENSTVLAATGWPFGREFTPNFHPYPPAWGGPENGLSAPCVSRATVLDCLRRLIPGSRAPWATESGYSTTGDLTSMAWVSRGAQAVYMPRLLLDNYAKGIARTYIYELTDLTPEITSSTAGYGLYESKYADPWSIVASRAKPAAYAIARLNARIGEAGAPVRGGGGLDFDLRDAAGQPIPDATVRRVLLRRNDGTLVLALWRPEPVWSNVQFKQRTLTVDELPVNVSIRTGIAGGWNATIFRPSVDDRADRVTGVNEFTTAVGADVTLIDLRGARYNVPVPGGPVELG